MGGRVGEKRTGHRLIDGLLIFSDRRKVELSAGLCLWHEWDLLKDVVNDSPRGQDNNIVE